MKPLRYLALVSLALIAVRLAGRALRRSDETTRLLWVLIATIASVGASNTPKTRAVEQRVAALVSSAATTNATLATTTTTANNTADTISSGSTATAQPAGVPTGPPGPSSTATADPAGQPTGGPNSTLYGLTTSDQTGGAASHTHTLPFYLPTATHGHDFDGHTHDMSSHTHDFDGHTHPLS